MCNKDLVLSKRWPFSFLETSSVEQKRKEWKQDPDGAASGAWSRCNFEVAEEERGQCPSWFSTASCTNWNLIQSHLLHSLPVPLFRSPLIFGDLPQLTARPSGDSVHLLSTVLKSPVEVLVLHVSFFMPLYMISYFNRNILVHQIDLLFADQGPCNGKCQYPILWTFPEFMSESSSILFTFWFKRV